MMLSFINCSMNSMSNMISYWIAGKNKKIIGIFFFCRYHGEGFEGPGHRVGQNLSHDPLSIGKTKKLALEQAEKRNRLSKIMLPVGGRKLGGSSSGYEKFYTPSQMAAIAAERRLKDEKWCANAHDHNSENGFGAIEDVDAMILNDKEKDKVNQEVYIISSDEEDDTAKQISKEKPRRNPKSSSPSEKKWECVVCTVINEPLVLICVCCNTIRQNNGLIDEYEEIHETFQRIAHAIEKQPVKTPPIDKWHCPDCTTWNAAQWTVCSGCQHIRYF